VESIKKRAKPLSQLRKPGQQAARVEGKSFTQRLRAKFQPGKKEGERP